MLEAEAAGGVSTPATQDAAWMTSREHPWRRAAGDGRVQAGDLVALYAGVLADGYLGEVGRTWPSAMRTSDRFADCINGGMICGTSSLRRAVPARRPATCSLRTRRPASRCRRCRSRMGSGSGFDPPVVIAETAGNRRRRAPRSRHGARRHRLRVGAGRRCGVQPGRDARSPPTDRRYLTSAVRGWPHRGRKC